MPLIFVSRYAIEEAIIAGGTQYVEGALSFASGTTIYLSNTVFGQSGSYVLFEYGTFPGGQAELDANVTVNVSALTYSDTPALIDDTANSRIILSIKSKADNGTQFVDGDLTLTDGAQIYLSSTLYATAGTYDLFTITGNLVSTTLDGSNYLTGVQVLPLKAGRSVVGGYAFWNAGAKKVQVTLT